MSSTNHFASSQIELMNSQKTQKSHKSKNLAQEEDDFEKPMNQEQLKETKNRRPLDQNWSELQHQNKSQNFQQNEGKMKIDARHNSYHQDQSYLNHIQNKNLQNPQLAGTSMTEKSNQNQTTIYNIQNCYVSNNNNQNLTDLAAANNFQMQPQNDRRQKINSFASNNHDNYIIEEPQVQNKHLYQPMDGYQNHQFNQNIQSDNFYDDHQDFQPFQRKIQNDQQQGFPQDYCNQQFQQRQSNEKQPRGNSMGLPQPHDMYGHQQMYQYHYPNPQANTSKQETQFLMNNYTQPDQNKNLSDQQIQQNTKQRTERYETDNSASNSINKIYHHRSSSIESRSDESVCNQKQNNDNENQGYEKMRQQYVENEEQTFNTNPFTFKKRSSQENHLIKTDLNYQECLNGDDFVPTHMLTRGYNCDEIITRQLPQVFEEQGGEVQKSAPDVYKKRDSKIKEKDREKRRRAQKKQKVSPRQPQISEQKQQVWCQQPLLRRDFQNQGSQSQVYSYQNHDQFAAPPVQHPNQRKSVSPQLEMPPPNQARSSHHKKQCPKNINHPDQERRTSLNWCHDQHHREPNRCTKQSPKRKMQNRSSIESGNNCEKCRSCSCQSSSGQKDSRTEKPKRQKVQKSSKNKSLNLSKKRKHQQQEHMRQIENEKLASLPNLSEVDYSQIPGGMSEIREMQYRYAVERWAILNHSNQMYGPQNYQNRKFIEKTQEEKQREFELLQVQWKIRKIGKITLEERFKKIRLYQAKRERRQWDKKISYDCRKQTADKRMRIKGRFIKKEDQVELLKQILGGDELLPQDNQKFNNSLKQAMHEYKENGSEEKSQHLKYEKHIEKHIKTQIQKQKRAGTDKAHLI